MEIKKILFRKEMKLVTLLLTSLLIASASAAVYYSLSLQSVTTVTSPLVKFVTATDFPGPGGDLTDSWVRLNLKSYPNATLTYERAVNISNTDSVSHDFRLTPGTPTGASSNWDYIRFLVYDNAVPGVLKGSLNYTGGGSWTNTGQTSWMTIGSSPAEWTIKVITRSPSGATVNAVCNIVISVDVKQ